MKILSISPYLPSEKTGHAGAQYIFRNLTALSKDHSIKSIFFIDNNELEFLNDLKINNIDYDYIIMHRNRFSLKKLSNGLRAFLRSKMINHPFMIEKYNQTNMKRLIEETICLFKPNIVHIEYNLMHHYVQCNSTIPFILTEHDITTKVMERLDNVLNSNSSHNNYHIWKSTEQEIIKKFDAFITLTNEDKEYAIEWDLPKCYVIPPQFNIPKIDAIKSKKLSLGFVGSFNRQPNIIALEKLIEIYPLIKKHHPDVVLQVAGRFLSDELHEKINRIEGIHFRGFVDKIDEMIAECTLFIAPIRVGAGLKMKILHSLSVGTPVLTTSIGAEGIPIGENNGLWIENSNDKFVSRCITLLNKPNDLNDIEENCKQAVQTHFSKDNILTKLEKMYNEVLEQYYGNSK